MVAKRSAARMGPTVWLLEGPMPMENISNTLIAVGGPDAAASAVDVAVPSGTDAHLPHALLDMLRTDTKRCAVVARAATRAVDAGFARREAWVVKTRAGLSTRTSIQRRKEAIVSYLCATLACRAGENTKVRSVNECSAHLMQVKFDANFEGSLDHHHPLYCGAGEPAVTCRM